MPRQWFDDEEEVPVDSDHEEEGRGKVGQEDNAGRPPEVELPESLVFGSFMASEEVKEVVGANNCLTKVGAVSSC